jgi:hypothetical protein
MKRLFSVVLIPLLVLPAFCPTKAATPEYSIQAIRYASAEDEVSDLVIGAPKGEKIAIAMVVWLIRGGAVTSSLTAAITAILSSRTSHRQNTFVPMKR